MVKRCSSRWEGALLGCQTQPLRLLLVRARRAALQGTGARPGRFKNGGGHEIHHLDCGAVRARPVSGFWWASAVWVARRMLDQ